MTHVQSVARLLNEKYGVTSLEYGIIAAFFAVSLVGIFSNFGKALVSLFSGITTSL
jgi:Flp pilus assembly pilin Flp